MASPLSFDPQKAKELYQRAHLALGMSGGSPAVEKQAFSDLKEIVYHLSPSHVDAHLELAELFLRYNNYTGAAVIINKLHAFNGNSEKSLLILARAQFLQKHYNDCKDTLDKIFHLNRGQLDAVLLSGQVAVYEKRYDEAIRIFEGLRDRKSLVGGVELFYNLALAHYGKMEFKKSVYYLKDIMSRSGSSPKVKRLYEIVTDKLVSEHVSSVFRDKNVPMSKKFKTWVQSYFFNAHLVESIQAAASSEVQVAIIGQQLYKDKLTGGLNVDAFMNYVPSYYASKKQNEKMYLCLLDIDFFKMFNDCYSHGVGDVVIITLNEFGQKHFPDRFFRVGGEEFSWVLIAENDDEPAKKAEEFRADIEKNLAARVNEKIRAGGMYRYANDYEVPSLRGELLLIGTAITISQGIAIYGLDGQTLESVKNAADGCLYIGKDSTGRNSVVFRSEVKSKGESPIRYTSAMLVALGKEAEKNNCRSWWDYAETLSKEKKSLLIDNARIHTGDTGR